MDAPDPPDPYETAAAQGSANTQASIAGSIVNNFNQKNPYGTVRYKRIGTETVRDAEGRKVKVPRYQQVVTLSPEQQRLYEQQTQLGHGLNDLAIGQVGRLDGLLGEPLDFSGLPARSTDFTADRQRVENAILGRLDERFDRDEDRVRARLASQGLTPGSAAYDQELDRLEQARTAARTDAILAGGQEQSRLFGMNEAARSAALSELLAERNQPINEISALMSGGQVSLPEAMPAYRQPVDAVPIGDYITNNYNQRMDAYRTGLSGLFGLGGTLLGGLLSDRRLKTDLRRVGTTDEGVPVYTFRYREGGPVHMGVMADELEQVRPEAVTTIGGLNFVDYGQVR